MNQTLQTAKAQWLPGLVLAAATLLAYWPALPGGFVWDDSSWTTDIVGRLQNAAGLWAIWVNPLVLQQYYPLAGTSFWLDYQFWHFWTLPYHVENVLLHLLAVLLLWRLLRRLQLPGAGLAAALFALHPVMVESVAWITERKNVLSLVLYLSALLVYLRYQRAVTSDRGQVTGNQAAPIVSPFSWRRSGLYCLALLLFLGALLAKTTAFSLPAVVLLLAWWKRGRLGWRTDVLPTLPFFALSAGMCAVTAWLEQNQIGAHGPQFDLSFVQRCLVAGRVFWFYLGKLAWPAHLCFVYPRWQPDPAVWWQWLYPLAAVGLLLGLWLARHRLGRGPATAALFYLGALFPLLGFMNAYGMLFSFVWDHWVYLPSLGPLALAAALLERSRQRLTAIFHLPSSILYLLPAALGVFTWRQARQFADMPTLWRTTLARNPTCWMAENNLGTALAAQGRPADAAQCYERALQLRPDFAEAECNLGGALARQGIFGEAIQHSERALQLTPDPASTGIIPKAHVNLGVALMAQGRPAQAIWQFQQALLLDPQDTGACCGLGAALVQQGKFAEAVAQFQNALRADPHNAEACSDLGFAFAGLGNWTEAVQQYQRALQLLPDFPQAQLGWGDTLARQGKSADALPHFQRALTLATAQGNSSLANAARARLQACAPASSQLPSP